MDVITTPIDMENVFEGSDFMYTAGGAAAGFVVAKVFKQNLLLFCVGGALAGFVYGKTRKN